MDGLERMERLREIGENGENGENGETRREWRESYRAHMNEIPVEVPVLNAEAAALLVVMQLLDFKVLHDGALRSLPPRQRA